MNRRLECGERVKEWYGGKLMKLNGDVPGSCRGSHLTIVEESLADGGKEGIMWSKCMADCVQEFSWSVKK